MNIKISIFIKVIFIRDRVIPGNQKYFNYTVVSISVLNKSCSVGSSIDKMT